MFFSPASYAQICFGGTYFQPCDKSCVISQDTRIRVIEKQTAGQKSCRLSITNPSPEGSESIEFSADTRDEVEDWLDALHQHLYDQGACFLDDPRVKEERASRFICAHRASPYLQSGQWLHCCEQLMKIEVASPRKPSLFLTKQADSVYNDLSEWSQWN